MNHFAAPLPLPEQQGQDSATPEFELQYQDRLSR